LLFAPASPILANIFLARYLGVSIQGRGMELQFKTVSVAISGDYYQVTFDDDLNDEDEPYFMIQKQLKLPPGEGCYFESHNEKLCGHSRTKSARIKANKLYLSYGENQTREVEITFGVNHIDYKYLVSTLKKMIPEISVRSS